MVVCNHQYNAANLNQSKSQFQLELSLAHFSPSLLFCLNDQWKHRIKWKIIFRQKKNFGLKIIYEPKIIFGAKSFSDNFCLHLILFLHLNLFFGPISFWSNAFFGLNFFTHLFSPKIVLTKIHFLDFNFFRT